MATKPVKLLFLCTHNACRSILAEAIFRQQAGDKFIAARAGSSPAGKVFPQTLEKLIQHGYNIEGLHSKSWEALSDYHPDIVITVCDQAAGESCPVWFGKAVKAHWGLTDASHIADTAERNHCFDALIQLLESRVEALCHLPLAELSSADISTELKRIGAMT